MTDTVEVTQADKNLARLIANQIEDRMGVIAIGDIAELVARHRHEATRELVEALDRQCDNMAFVLNRVDLHGFHGKFDRELAQDREVAAKHKEQQT